MITQQYTTRQANEFKRFFKRSLSEFWDGPILGFDVVKFDDEVVKSDVQTPREAIRQTWGVEASNLICELTGAAKE